MLRSFCLREVMALDETGGFYGPLDVHVVEGEIAAIGRRLRAEGTQPFDFSGLWLMPGVVDCHNHVAASTLDPAVALRTPVTLWTARALANARHSLEAGVTLVRDPGGADAGIRAAIEQGLAPGPRLQIAVVMLSQTGGHADGFLRGPGLELTADLAPGYPGRPPSLVDGVDGVRCVVRQVLRAGADWVKLCTTGGVLSDHDAGEAPELTLEEIEAAVFEGRRRGKPAMAHAFGGEGLDNALSAGVRSIEHGLFLTEEQAARMAAAGCFLVPTLLTLREVIGWARAGELPPQAAAKALALEPLAGEAVRVARAHGVKMALGSDFVRADQHGRNLEELPLLHAAGLTVEEALLAATANGAQLCGVGDRLGRLSPGYVFDAIVLDEDPGDLSLFERPGAVTAVFKDGVPAVPHERFAPR